MLSPQSGSGSEPSSPASPTSEFGSREFYDALWSNDWFDMERYNPTARHLERIIVKTLRSLGPVQSLVDVGCGIGVNVKRIHANFPDLPLVGTDISSKGIELARRYVGESPAIEYHVLNVEEGVLPRTFDVVLCSQVLEHIRDDRLALKNLRKMTGKYLLMTVPGGKYNSTSKLMGHYRHYSKRELVEKVTAAGFTVVQAYDWGFPAHSLYKFLLDQLPADGQKSIGFGKFGFGKRLISHLLFLLFYVNRFDFGANVILLAKPQDRP